MYKDPSLLHRLSTPTSLSAIMGAQERVSNEPLIPMNSMPGGPTQRDPPPYAYSSLSPPRSPPPPTKTSISPPPRESTFSPIPDTPATSSHVPTITPMTSELPQTVADSRQQLLAQDARFADVILTHVVLPRARVGILRCKDKLSLALIPQTEDDVATTFVTVGLICRPRKIDIGLNMMKSWGFRRRSTGIDIMLWSVLLGRD